MRPFCLGLNVLHKVREKWSSQQPIGFFVIGVFSSHNDNSLCDKASSYFLRNRQVQNGVQFLLSCIQFNPQLSLNHWVSNCILEVNEIHFADQKETYKFYTTNDETYISTYMWHHKWWKMASLRIKHMNTLKSKCRHFG